jgi:hypothetical protein
VPAGGGERLRGDRRRGRRGGTELEGVAVWSPGSSKCGTRDGTSPSNRPRAAAFGQRQHLADLADATGLTAGFSGALARLRVRQGGHDPGRVAVDLAVMLADGGEMIADLAVLRHQVEPVGAVASDPTRVPLIAGSRDQESSSRTGPVRGPWAQVCGAAELCRHLGMDG